MSSMKSAALSLVLCLLMVLPSAVASTGTDLPGDSSARADVSTHVPCYSSRPAPLPDARVEPAPSPFGAESPPDGQTQLSTDLPGERPPAEPPSGLPDGPEGGADGRLVVLSNATNITLAIGTFNTALKHFPDPKTNIGTLVKGVPVEITGQLVDGNFTELAAGGAAAALKNHGIANIIQMVHWEFNGEPQAPLPLSWRNPDDVNDTDINGTFFITNWAPEVPKADLYPIAF